MFNLSVVEERSLKAICDGSGNEPLIIRKGVWVAGTYPRNYKFEKFIIGPGRSFGDAFLGNLKRTFTGEKIQLVKVIPAGRSETYYAYNALNVSVVNLERGDELSIESEHLLSFYDCDYDVKMMGTGVMSQGGIFTTILRGRSRKSQVAILSEGNVIQLNTPCAVDPDAYLCHTGPAPHVNTDITWRNFIGQHSGETYMFEFTTSGELVFIQPSERSGGISLSID